MNRSYLSAVLVLFLAAGDGLAHPAAADPNPAAAPDQSAGPPGPWRGPDHHHGGPGPGWGPMGMGQGGSPRDDKFSLFSPVQNKNLSTADVKTIATAILLEHGNHDWAVTNIVAEADKSIDFSFTTPHGDVIATFAVDPESGHITRVGYPRKA